MPAPLPEALRTRFQRLIKEGLSGRAAALRLKVSAATGARWSLAIRQRGDATPAPQGRPKGKGKLDPHRVSLRSHHSGRRYHDAGTGGGLVRCSLSSSAS